jgi:periplasmic protein TonB
MSDLGNLSQCMVDNDPEVRARARRLRQKALVASLCVEAVCLGGMLLWPLITPGVLTAGYIFTPVPPYRGGSGRTHSTSAHRPVPHHGPVIIHDGITFPSPNAHSHSQVAIDDDAPPTLYNDGMGIGADGPPGPLIPNGGDRPALAPPPPAVLERPVRRSMSEGVMEGALIHRVQPDYPTLARNIHLSGVVRLRAIIATDGSVQNLEVLSGHPILARAAEDAVRQWRYRPTLLSGVPVEVETYITVNFLLGGQ